MAAELIETRPQAIVKRRKITKEDVEQMANLMAKRITETGACLILGIKPDSWFQFKRRGSNQSKFETVLTHAREAKLKAVIETIDSAGNPYEVVTKSGATFMRPGDWRAKAWMAERVLAPERFAEQKPDHNVNVTILSPERMAAIEASITNNKQAIDVQEVKSLKDVENTGDK